MASSQSSSDDNLFKIIELESNGGEINEKQWKEVFESFKNEIGSIVVRRTLKSKNIQISPILCEKTLTFTLKIIQGLDKDGAQFIKFSLDDSKIIQKNNEINLLKNKINLLKKEISEKTKAIGIIMGELEKACEQGYKINLKKNENQQKCSYCGPIPGKCPINLKQCSGCKNAYYCNIECQKKHWKSHKKNCKNGSKH